MCCTMAPGKSISLLLVFLASTSAFSHSYVPEARGRKLFGGYRIVPKVCKPTIPSQMKSDEPAICMFNYECSRRNGEVVGACMDGFLFGACCQLPPKNVANNDFEKISSSDELLHAHEIDHVPEIPILLNPDGSPMGMTVSEESQTTKTESPASTNDLSNEEITYTKLSTFSPTTNTGKPSTGQMHNMDSLENAEKPQIPLQPDITHMEEDFPALLGQQSILDDLNLPGLLTHSDSNNDIQDHQDNTAVNPVTTLLSPDQILQIADPVDQLPALFSQGLGQNNYSAADTILLNENGTRLEETLNPDDFIKLSTDTAFNFTTEIKKDTQSSETTERTTVTESMLSTEAKKATTQSSTYQTPTSQRVRFPDEPLSSSTESTLSTQDESTTVMMSRLPVVTQMYANTQKLSTNSASSYSTDADQYEKVSIIEERVSTSNTEYGTERSTTPMAVSHEKNDGLIRVPTITYDAPSGNKKNDIVDKEELAINHIISILNDTTPGSENSVTVQGPSSSIHTWVSIDETSKPTLVKASTSRPSTLTTSSSHTFPYTFFKPAQPSSYYNYETVPTESTYSAFSTSNSHSSRPSTQGTYGSSSFGYSTRSTTNPPAPTVIVLGPLGTEFTTETTQKSITRKPTTETTRPLLVTAKPTSTPLKPSSVSTKKPNVSTTITHNISTVISNVANNNNHVVSTSFISVNLKDGTSAKPTTSSEISTESVVVETATPEQKITTKRPTIWTTISSWSDKPSFHLRPSTAAVSWSQDNLTPVNTIILKEPNEAVAKPSTHTPCDDETAAPDDLINFPPVRNPNLNISAPTSQQEKPTIVETFNHTGYPDLVSENDIPTPTFIEDDVLTNKVDAFVNKIVESLQGNFQDLKDIVYNRNNTQPGTQPTVTRRPTVGTTTTKRPTRRPTQTTKPSSVTTKRPVTTRRPATRPATTKPSPTEKPTRVSKPTTQKVKPPTTTKRPSVTTKRTRPTKKPTTTTAPSTEAVLEETNPTVTTELTTTTSSDVPTFRSECGVRPLVKTGRIVGGKAATFGEWPWQVLVREATWLGLFTKNKCGGVLITDRYVITAAHCQPGFLATLVAVFGEFDLSGELESKRSITRNVRRVIVNRGYDPATFENDLALLELESPVQFDAHIVPICMPDNDIDFTGRMATVTGWGRLKYNGGVPSRLQEVQVPIIKNSVCQEMFQTAGHSKLILDSFLCAGYATGEKDSCEGDSGGPLVMEKPDGRWFLVGTVSHGIKCASPYLPGVYMRTTYFKPWLHSITGV